MSSITNVSSHASPLLKDSDLRKAEVLTSLRLLGADEYDLLLPETHCLPHRIMPDELIQGVIYGRYKKQPGNVIGRGLLVITDRRLMLLDRKVFYLQEDDIKFSVVSGIDYSQAGPAATITLHTRLGDISFRTFNMRAGRRFVLAVQNMLYHTNGEDSHDHQSR